MADISKLKTVEGETYTLKDALARQLISELPDPMVFRGTIGGEGSGATITELPTASSTTVGHVYKVITEGTYSSMTAKIGDMFICDNTPAWVYVPSGDDEGNIDAIKVNGQVITPVNKVVDIPVPTQTSDLTNDGSGDGSPYATTDAIPTRVGQLVNDSGYQVASDVASAISSHNSNANAHSDIRTAISNEVNAREDADSDLQEQIDAISSKSDVVDVVGTYAELEEYDTTKLQDNDIIKVLADEEHDDAESYYRWVITSEVGAWDYIGSQGPFITPAEASSTYVPLTRTINSKALSSDITLTASDVSALPSSTYISDKTITMQKNNQMISSFSLNSNADVTINYDIPTKVTDLSDASEYAKASAIPTKTSDLSNDGSDGTHPFITAEYHDSSKQNVIDASHKLAANLVADLADVATSGSYNDLSNKPTIPDELADLSGDTTHRTVTDAQISSWTAKQDAIADLEDIREGADLGSTSVQPGDNVSDLDNDAGYITSAYHDSSKQDTLTAGTGITIVNNVISSTASGGNWGEIGGNIADQTDLVDALDAKQDEITSSNKLSASLVSGLASVATTGDYDDLNNKPSIPTKVSELTNDAGYTTNVGTITGITMNGASKGTSGVVNLGTVLTEHQDISGKADIDGLSSVAFSGSYSDLSDKPTIPTKVSELTNDSGYTTNIGTITGITMNGSSKGTSGVVDLGTVLTAHQDISGKANLASPTFTGTPKAPTAANGTNTTQIATTEFVQNAISSISGSMTFKGTVGTGGTVTTLPTSGVKVGDTYKVITAGTYASQAAKVGDLFIATATTPTWAYVPSGDDENVIEVIKKNGTTLPITSKAVDISVPTSVSGTVSKPTFTGTQGSVSVTGTPSGSVSIGTGTGTANYTPAGSVSQPTFTGSSMTSTGNFTPSGSVSLSNTNKTATVAPASSGDATYTPAGSCSGGGVTLNTTTVNSITAVGSLPTLTFTPNSSTGNLTIAWSAGTLPTKGSNTTVATSVNSFTQPTFTGTGVRLVTGNIAVPSSASFTGTQGSVSVSGTPSGSVSKPTFTGTGVQLTGSFSGNSLTSSGNFTPAGSVSQPTFSGSLS